MNETETDISLRDGTRIRVRHFDGGDGSADAPALDLLLLHGWPNSGRVWKPLAAELLLANPGLRLHAPDLRGFGDSDKPAGGYHCRTFAEDVLEIAAALMLDDYVLVGHSMSGKIAQIAAAEEPPGLAALVLVTPGLLAASPPVDISGRKAIFGVESRVRDMVTSWAAHPLGEEFDALLTEDALRTSRDAWNGWLSPMRDEDFSPVAPQIHVKTLVVGGGRDPQRTDEELRRGVLQKISGAEYVRLPSSGHLPHLEEPDALALLIVNFLDGAPVGEPAAA